MSVPVPKYYLITNILRQTFSKYGRLYASASSILRVFAR